MVEGTGGVPGIVPTYAPVKTSFVQTQLLIALANSVLKASPLEYLLFMIGRTTLNNPSPAFFWVVIYNYAT